VVHPRGAHDIDVGADGLAECLIIVPAFNEESTLPRVLYDLRRVLPGADIVVVDDGSTDGTASVVPDSVALLRLPFNLGIGGAMQAGYRYAHGLGYRIAVQVDGDGQHQAEEVDKLIAALKRTGADLVIGSRFLERGSYRQSPAREIGSVLLRGAIRLVSRVSLTDCTSGFRAANGRAIELFAHWYPDDYPEPEVAALLVRNGCRVVEVPARMNPRTGGRSSITLAAGLVYVAKVGIALFLDVFRNPWKGAGLDRLQPARAEAPASSTEAEAAGAWERAR
jgi:hypothetical protein